MALNLTKKAEQAFLAVIRDLEEFEDYSAEVMTAAGHASMVKTRPIVTVEAVNTEEVLRDMGIFAVTIRVTVTSESDEEEAGPDVNPMEQVHGELAEAVLEGLKRDNLHALLTEAMDDFHVYEDGVEDMGTDPGTQGRNFTDANLWKIVCCANDLDG